MTAGVVVGALSQPAVTVGGISLTSDIARQ